MKQSETLKLEIWDSDNMKVILASGSPRRKELLTQAGIEYEVCPADIEEVVTSSDPEAVVKELSLQKAQAVAVNYKDEIVLAADTVVACNGKILGKPTDRANAIQMLQMLSGKIHQVYTGVTIISTNGEIINFAECTDVEMYDNSIDEITSYVDSGDGADKAGAYGIQTNGVVLVKGIKGDYNNVVGLPLSRVYRELMRL